MTFVDSNVWLYALLDDREPQRHTTAMNFLASLDHPVVSPQVINEVCTNLQRKGGLSEARLRETVTAFYRDCEVTPVSEASMLRASELRERYSLSFWDSQIVACALLAGCATLVSEDMDHGLVIDGTLTIQNPFR